MSAQDVKFDTTDYESTHGAKPRGVRHWALVPSDYIWPGDKMPFDAIAWAWGSYSDAKREVVNKWPAVTNWTVMA